MPFPVAAAIAAGASLLGSGVNAASTASMNKKTRKWNEKMYAQQRADALADWNMQNEYNSPLSQMQRLRDAKLNPNLVYGNGADTTAGVVRSTDAQSWHPDTPRWGDMASGAAGAGLSAYYDIQLKEAQIDNLKTLNTIQIQDAALRAAQVENTKTNTESTRFDLGLRGDLRDNSLQVAEASLKKLQADVEATGISTRVLLNRDEREAIMQSQNIAESLERIARMRSQNATDSKTRDQLSQNIEILKKEGVLKDLDINLRKMGINPSDPTWQRIIAQGVASLSKIDAPELLKDVWQGKKSYNQAAGSLNHRILQMFGLK